MPRFLNTRGQPTLGIAICSRCQRKAMLADLIEDGNIKNFYVHKPHLSPGCWDKYDPFRLPPRQPDKLTLPFVRPDVPMDVPAADAAQLPLEPSVPPANEPTE